jgi:hypothetical protein
MSFEKKTDTSIYNSIKNIKKSESKLTKEKKLYSKNYKTLLKRIQENLNKWKNTTCARIRTINIVIAIFQIFTCRFNTFCIRSISGYFTEIDC